MGSPPDENPLDVTVLVVDDSMTLRRMLQFWLETSGYRVLTAVDGHHAWTVARTESVDVIVSDIQMPRVDGLSLAKVVRESPLGALPIILLSDTYDPTIREAVAEHAIDALMLKRTLDVAQLLDTVEELVGANQLLAAD